MMMKGALLCWAALLFMAANLVEGQTTTPSLAPVTERPVISPTRLPTTVPTTAFPTNEPTLVPSATPTASFQPSVSPQPSAVPTRTRMPTAKPTPWPTPEPTAGPEPEDEANIGMIVIVMLIAVMVPICCGCNRSKILVDEFQSAEQAAADFRQEIMTKRRFVVTIPQFTACGKTKSRREYALFYSTRIKAHWKPLHTYAQMALGWLGLVTTIVALFAPENKTNNVVGFTALFMNELLTHTWYGYIRYLFKGCGGMCSKDGVDDIDDSDFEDMKTLFGILYHGGHHELENAYWVDIMGFPFYAVMYLSTVLAFVGTFVALGVLKCVGKDDDDGKKKRSRKDDDTLDVEGMAGLSAFVGIVIGCFAYPLMFLAFNTAAGKVFASFMHHCLSEYYEAKLFRKKPFEFVWSVVLKVFGDFVGVEDFDDNPDFQDAWNELRAALDEEKIKDGDDDPENPSKPRGWSEEPESSTVRDETETMHSDGSFPLVQTPSPVLPLVLPMAPPLDASTTDDEGRESSSRPKAPPTLVLQDDSKVSSDLANIGMGDPERKKKKKKKEKKREHLAHDESIVSDDMVGVGEMEVKEKKKRKKSKKKQENMAGNVDSTRLSDHLDSEHKVKKKKKEKSRQMLARDDSEVSGDGSRVGRETAEKKKRKKSKKKTSKHRERGESFSEASTDGEGKADRSSFGGGSSGVEDVTIQRAV